MNSSMNCENFHSQLESWLEGERTSAAESHLRSCHSCQAIVQDLDAIHSAAQDWSREEVPAPSTRVWNSLKAQLESEGLIRAHGSAPAEESSSWFDRLLPSFARPAMAGAYLVALMAGGLLLSSPGSQQMADQRWMEGTRNTTSPVRTELDAAETSVASYQPSDPVVMASLHKNLGIVDNYIALCEKSMQEEPGNETVRDYLYTAYQQKADLLAEMTDHGDEGR